MHDLEPNRQNHLWDVLVRYTDWVNALPPDQRKRIDEAPDDEHRLTVVRELRQKDWLARLPQKDRQEVAALPPDQLTARLAEYRKQEQQRRQEWAEWAEWAASQRWVRYTARVKRSMMSGSATRNSGVVM